MDWIVRRSYKRIGGNTSNDISAVLQHWTSCPELLCIHSICFRVRFYGIQKGTHPKPVPFEQVIVYFSLRKKISLHLYDTGSTAHWRALLLSLQDYISLNIGRLKCIWNRELRYRRRFYLVGKTVESGAAYEKYFIFITMRMECFYIPKKRQQ